MSTSVPQIYLTTSSNSSGSSISSVSSSSSSELRSRESSFSLKTFQHGNPAFRSSATNLIQPVHKDFSLLNKIDDLKSQVSISYKSMEISSAEEDLKHQILEFQSSLNQLKGLRSECVRMLGTFVTDSEQSAIIVDKKMSLLREQMSGFTILDSLEKRIKKVQAIIDSRTKKLNKINDWVAKQEDSLIIKKHRLQKIWKMSLVSFIIGFCLLLLVYLFIKS